MKTLCGFCEKEITIDESDIFVELNKDWPFALIEITITCSNCNNSEQGSFSPDYFYLDKDALKDFDNGDVFDLSEKTEEMRTIFTLRMREKDIKDIKELGLFKSFFVVVLNRSPICKGLKNLVL